MQARKLDALKPFIPNPFRQHYQQGKRLIDQYQKRHRRTYVSPRVHAELQTMGVICSENRVARLVRLNGIAVASAYEKKIYQNRFKPPVTYCTQSAGSTI